ncbi:hypothetical protein BN14_11317 [Rhizoctonia solani AG-1 IB]|uniref:Zn(2)-C6 fungal-type domain-containing protein n=1 Tax=Thanatephorus cucumeris (strain AG1-IB / isolate 7/3/14) TaxID=1108050 RepID=M5CDG9_THACB|nr:hypothetical protein BN14_11317 [Rhizoctonia solani AG-1 IB]
MAAPTPTPTHSAPPSTSPGPATTTTATTAGSDMFPPTAAYATFMHSVLSEMLHELKAVRKELQDIRRNQPGQPTPSANRKRKRPGPTAPCALCRLSRTPCIAAHASEACARCIRKQVHCFDDSENPEQPRVRHPPEDDGPEDAESELEVESIAPPAPPAPVWQQPASNGIPAYPTPGYPPTPVKRERVTKACADCHARKRKCTGGPNCGSRQNASSTRPSPQKPAGTTPNSRAREPCAECRGRKRRCMHHIDGTNGTTNNNKSPEEQDELDPLDELPPTDTEPEPSESARLWTLRRLTHIVAPLLLGDGSIRAPHPHLTGGTPNNTGEPRPITHTHTTPTVQAHSCTIARHTATRTRMPIPMHTDTPDIRPLIHTACTPTHMHAFLPLLICDTQARQEIRPRIRTCLLRSPNPPLLFLHLPRHLRPGGKAGPALPVGNSRCAMRTGRS